jgi:sulfoxide reductase heme-binding subunit YedZ
VLTSRWTKVAVFALCLAPLFVLAWAAYKNELGANPIEYITHATGDWTLRFLAMTLAVTPLRKLLKLPDLIRFRRMLGLFAFFYGCLHLTTYVWLDKFFDWPEIVKDIAKRPFITAGFTAWVLMLPLALTSTAASIRWLGGKRWRALHRAVYISAMAGVVHYYWLVKSDVRKPVLYGTIVGALLIYRLATAIMAKRPAPRKSGSGVKQPVSL